MLKALSIQNIAVAKNLNIDFYKGFTVLTGKTGAGKSVIIDSIALLLGAKGQRDLIRQGEKSASVVAVFDGEPDTDLFDENGELQNLASVTWLIVGVLGLVLMVLLLAASIYAVYIYNFSVV